MAAPAQNWLTSPVWLGGQRGDSSNEVHNPWTSPEARFQFVDRSLRGHPGTIDQIQMRRDERALPEGAPRTTDLMIRMAHCNIEQVANSFDANNRDRWVTVFQGPITLPRTTSTTIGWSLLTLPQFQRPFTYNGQDDLLIEFACRNTTETSVYPLDATDGRRPGLGSSSYPWPESGCAVGPGRFTILARQPRTNAQDMAVISTYATGAAPSTPAALLWGFEGAAPPLAGLCGQLRLQPILMGSPATVDALGNIGRPSQPLRFRFPAQRNGNLAIQFVGVAPGSRSTTLRVSDPARLRIQQRDQGNLVKMVWTHAAADAPLGEATDQQVPVLRVSLR